MNFNLKNVNDCFIALQSLEIYYKKIHKTRKYNYSKKESDNLHRKIAELNDKIEKYQKSFNREENQHYIDLQNAELFKRNIKSNDIPKYKRFVTIN
jgi:hypothetical protein